MHPRNNGNGTVPWSVSFGSMLLTSEWLKSRPPAVENHIFAQCGYFSGRKSIWVVTLRTGEKRSDGIRWIWYPSGEGISENDGRLEKNVSSDQVLPAVTIWLSTENQCEAVETTISKWLQVNNPIHSWVGSLTIIHPSPLLCRYSTLCIDCFHQFFWLNSAVHISHTPYGFPSMIVRPVLNIFRRFIWIQNSVFNIVSHQPIRNFISNRTGKRSVKFFFFTYIQSEILHIFILSSFLTVLFSFLILLYQIFSRNFFLNNKNGSFWVRFFIWDMLKKRRKY